MGGMLALIDPANHKTASADLGPLVRVRHGLWSSGWRSLPTMNFSPSDWSNPLKEGELVKQGTAALIARACC